MAIRDPRFRHLFTPTRLRFMTRVALRRDRGTLQLLPKCS